MTNFKTYGFRESESSLRGKHCERQFSLMARRRGNKDIIVSNDKEDIFEHWDYKIQNRKIDVKSLKSPGNGRPLDEDLVIVEFRNVDGKDGWIHGLADLIVFERNKEFVFFEREKLRDRCYEFRNKYLDPREYEDIDCYSKWTINEKGHWYSRHELSKILNKNKPWEPIRYDMMYYADFHDIKDLIVATWKKDEFYVEYESKK